jgi:hypothetical protein
MKITKTLTKWITGAALAGALLFAAPKKADAQVSFGISVGRPVYGYGYGYRPYAYGYPAPYAYGYPAPVYGGYYGRPYYRPYYHAYYGRPYGYGWRR